MTYHVAGTSVFVREYSNAKIQMDCATWRSSITFKSDDPAAALQLWPCSNGSSGGGAHLSVPALSAPPSAHRQDFVANRSDNSLKVVGASDVDGLCVDRSGNHQFAALLLSPCDQRDGQLWNVSALRGEGLFVIQSLMPGSDFGCIGASAPVRAGTPLQLAPDCGTVLTEWQQIPPSIPKSAAVRFRLKYAVGHSAACK